MEPHPTDDVELTDDELSLAAGGGKGGWTNYDATNPNNAGSGGQSANSTELIFASTFIPFDSSF